MEKFEQILEKYNFPKRISQTKTTIEEVEDIIQFELPIDYKTYIQNYTGFEEHIGQEFVRLWDLDELIEMNQDYQIFDYLPQNAGNWWKRKW